MASPYRFFPIPDVNKSPEEWVTGILDDVISVGRAKVILFKNFPPEYVDYYKKLQEEIAKKIPNEQERPLICLTIRGKQENKTASFRIGLAGGTGPLSDATTLENLVRKISNTPQGSLSENRTAVKAAMENFSCILYSMPPPRDFKHFLRDAISYRKLYKATREDMPCRSLHILTNTGHAHKWAFNSRLFLGREQFGAVDDMTAKIADQIKNNSSKKSRVLILGTLQADQAKLYSNLLKKRKIKAYLPTGSYNNDNAKEYLQRIIDQVKAGEVNEKMPGETGKTCGRAFIDFTKIYIQLTQSNSLLFSCTELSILLHTKVPNDNMERTYLDILNEETGNHCHYYDSEKLFVEIIVKREQQLAITPEGPAMPEALTLPLSSIIDTILWGSFPTVVGAIVGSVLFPGLGTIIGAGVGLAIACITYTILAGFSQLSSNTINDNDSKALPPIGIQGSYSQMMQHKIASTVSQNHHQEVQKVPSIAPLFPEPSPASEKPDSSVLTMII